MVSSPWTVGICILLSVMASYQAADMSNFANSNDRAARFVRTMDPSKYGAWPRPAAIPYRLDPRYSLTDIQTIGQALQQIASDMTNCIQFVPYVNATDFNLKPHLYISSTTNFGVQFPTCFSFPGLMNSVGSSSGAQKLGIVNSIDGCMNKREIMKYLANSLGLRDEWRRPDRDLFIRVDSTRIKTTLGTTPAEIVRLYNVTTGTTVVTPGISDNLTTSFDLNSISMIAPTKYTINPAAPFYTVIAGTVPGQLARLSRDDCRGLQAIYSTLGCSAIVCQDPYLAAGGVPTVLPALPPVANPVTFTPGVTGVSGISGVLIPVPPPIDIPVAVAGGVVTGTVTGTISGGDITA